MADYALVDAQGIVQNVIVWDGVTPFDSAGLTIVPTNGATAWMYGTFDGSQFHPPAA